MQLAARPAGSRGAGVHRSVLFLEDVLDLVAGLLEVTLGLVDLAFGFQFLVVGGPAYAFLDLALDFRGLVGRLVFSRHSLARSFLFGRLTVLVRGGQTALL